MARGLFACERVHCDRNVDRLKDLSEIFANIHLQVPLSRRVDVLVVLGWHYLCSICFHIEKNWSMRGAFASQRRTCWHKKGNRPDLQAFPRSIVPLLCIRSRQGCWEMHSIPVLLSLSLTELNSVGGFNRLFLLTLDNGKEVVVRMPFKNSGPRTLDTERSGHYGLPSNQVWFSYTKSTGMERISQQPCRLRIHSNGTMLRGNACKSSSTCKRNENYRGSLPKLLRNAL